MFTFAESEYRRARTWVEGRAPLTWQEFKGSFPRQFVIAKGAEYIQDRLVEPPIEVGPPKRVGGPGFGFRDFVLNPSAKKLSKGEFTYNRTKKGIIQKHSRANGHFAPFTIDERRFIQSQRPVKSRSPSIVNQSKRKA